MAKKNLVRKSPRTQASRNRKQTPPKKKGQLVKSKGKPGPLAPAAPLAFAGTDTEIEDFLNYLFTCSETSNYRFHSSRQSKIGYLMGQLREALEAWITCQAEVLCANWVIKVRNNQRQRPFRWTSSPSRRICEPYGGNNAPFISSSTTYNCNCFSFLSRGSGQEKKHNKNPATIEIEATINAIKSELINQTIDDKFSISSETDSQITFEATYGFVTRTDRIQFTLAKSGTSVKVTASCKRYMDLGAGYPARWINVTKKYKSWLEPMLEKTKIKLEFTSQNYPIQ